MAIVWDDENKRMVDTENGEFLSLTLRDREDHEYFASIKRSDGLAQVAGEVIAGDGGEHETPEGGVSVRTYTLKRAWIPSGRREPPSNFDVPQHLIDRLALFLEEELRRIPYLTKRLRFEFIDARHVNGGAR